MLEFFMQQIKIKINGFLMLKNDYNAAVYDLNLALKNEPKKYGQFNINFARVQFGHLWEFPNGYHNITEKQTVQELIKL